MGKITTPPKETKLPSNFKYAEVFGVGIAAEPEWSAAKFKHVCGVMAQYLDNDADGCADDNAVVGLLASKNAEMVMMKKAENRSKYNFDKIMEFTSAWQDLQGNETRPDCSGTEAREDCRDAALEEVLHLISSHG